jgi:hypothetical protein
LRARECHQQDFMLEENRNGRPSGGYTLYQRQRGIHCFWEDPN